MNSMLKSISIHRRRALKSKTENARDSYIDEINFGLIQNQDLVSTCGINEVISPKSIDLTSKVRKKSKITQQLAILKEMGFLNNFKPNMNHGSESTKSITKKFTIGISEFWSDSYKKKFLRNEGYMETFKSMQKDEINDSYKRKKSDRLPTLPYIMDNHSIRRTIAEPLLQISPKIDNENIKLGRFYNNLQEKIIKDENKCELIDQVISKCDSLAAETKKLRYMSIDFHHNIDQNIRKITRKNTMINF